MHKWIEVGAVLLLAGCGAGFDPGEEAAPAIEKKPVVTANADDPSPDCPAGTYGLKAIPGMQNSATGTLSVGGGGGGGDMMCQSCDPTGGGDPAEPVPYGSTYVRSLGGRTYTFHPNSIRPHTVNARIFNTYGTAIGHVSFGGRDIPEGYYGGHAQSYVSAHIYAPNNGTNMWIRFGVARAGDGQAFVWSAVKPGPYAPWSRYLTIAGFKQWMNGQPAAVQQAIYAAAQAAEDTNKKEPAGSPVKDLFNANGSCTGTTFLTVLALGLTGCMAAETGLGAAVCYMGLATAGACVVTWVVPWTPSPPDQANPAVNPIPSDPSPGPTVPVPDPENPQQPVNTDPGDGGGTGGSNGGDTGGAGPYAPEGDGGGGGGGGGAGCP